MKLVFVIPAYNEEALIGRCLESVQREIRMYRCETEVLVVNNGSTDRTGAIASSFPGVQVIDEPVKGLVQARNAGFMASTAELVANIDADTIVPPGWMTTVLQCFEADKDLVALSGPFIYYDLSRPKRSLVKAFYYGGFLIYLFNRHVLRVGSMIQGGNYVIRRSAWCEVGGYDRTIPFYGEDTDVARRLTRIGAVRWTFALPMYASGRRLKVEGMLTMGLRYAANYLWMTFAGRPFSLRYKDIRQKR